MSAVALQPATQAVCALCGQRLPARPSQGDYCCSGCAHVAAILQAVGPETEAAQRALKAARARGLLSAPAPLASQSTTHHSLLTTHTGDVPPEAREELRLRVQGLACPSCAWLVEAVLTSYPGVAEARVDYLSDTARVVLDLRLTSREAIERAVAEAGYGLAPLETEGDPEERRDLLRFALAAFVAMNQMTLSWVGYDAFLTGQDDPRALVVGWLQLALALPVVTWSALPLYRRALAALRRGRAVMETLLSLGVLAATALSLAAVLAGQTHVYLETATTLVALSLAGRALERWLKRRATRSLTDLLRFAPTKARGADDGRFAPLGTLA
ncbi:MAG: cation-translocating P-type ATPase, partial [Planctomycetes bacterium]|nr:cation-translocating P-type ATPase [Planctomycetota bacterium]